MGTRKLTPQDDYDRLANRLFNQYEIYNLKTFNDAWVKYLGEVPRGHGVRSRDSYEEVKKILTKRINLKGTQLEDERKEILRESKEGRISKEDFKYVGETKARFPKGLLTAAEMEAMRTKTVYARETYVTIKGQKRRVFRDRKGRFVSVKKGK